MSPTALHEQTEHEANLRETDYIVRYGWRMSMDYQCPDQCVPFSLPRLRQLPELVGMSVRYFLKFYLKKRYSENRKPFIDGLNPVLHRPIYGVPLGGIGCGSIGRGYKGEFCRFALKPGMYEYNTIEANQFLLTVRKRGQTVYQQVLNPQKEARTPSLRSWNWGFCAQQATYYGLYPRSVTVYRLPNQKLTLICRQLSPIIPHDYQDSSLPVALFSWTVENHSDEVIDVSITFTWKNGNGTTEDRKGGCHSESFVNDTAAGVLLHQTFGDMPCTYAVAADTREKTNVSACTNFNPNGNSTKSSSKSTPEGTCPRLTAAQLWSDLLDSGQLNAVNGTEIGGVTKKGEEMAIAVCQQMSVPAAGQTEATFSLAWDMPKVHFRANERQYTRRYYRWHKEGAAKLAEHAILSREKWEDAIDRWQNPILNNKQYPEWYKSALFNELYYVSDSGSVWLDRVDEEDEDEDLTLHGDHQSELYRKLLNSDIKKEIGLFGYLEGHEYRMYNTYDVHYYASWALLHLWPKIQLALQYDFAAATAALDDTPVYYVHSALTDVRNARHSVPHDLGDPEDEPWKRVNSYIMFPTHDWKDLNSKFVLSVYRDWKCTKNEQYLRDILPVVKDIMNTNEQFDRDGDGLIENSGYSDQTYDAWRMTGPSAYCAGLWLASVQAIGEMLEHCGEDSSHWRNLMTQGAESYETKLWTGSHYRYDDHSDSCMSDQLNGQWYLRASGADTDSLFPKERVHSALNTIYRLNVLCNGEGQFGAMNGMRPNGRKDVSSVQSEEIWIGVTYALSAAMIQEGMWEKAFLTSEGMYKMIYERYGLHYQTPEAVLDNKRYRSLGYMRPLSIWAMQHALERNPPPQTD